MKILESQPVTGEALRGMPGTVSMVPGGVVLKGTGDEVERARAVLAAMDVAPAEYLVDVVLLSVDTTEETQSGVTLLADTLADAANGLEVSIEDSGGYVRLAGGSLSDLVASCEASEGRVKLEGRSQLSVSEGRVSKLVNGEQRAVITETTSDGDSVQSSYEYIDIGVSLTVEVLQGSTEEEAILQLQQTADDVTGTSSIGGDEIPIIGERKVQTVVRVEPGGNRRSRRPQAPVLGGSRTGRSRPAADSSPWPGLHVHRAGAPLLRAADCPPAGRPAQGPGQDRQAGLCQGKADRGRVFGRGRERKYFFRFPQGQETGTQCRPVGTGISLRRSAQGEALGVMPEDDLPERRTCYRADTC